MAEESCSIPGGHGTGRDRKGLGTGHSLPGLAPSELLPLIWPHPYNFHHLPAVHSALQGLILRGESLRDLVASPNHTLNVIALGIAQSLCGAVRIPATALAVFTVPSPVNSSAVTWLPVSLSPYGNNAGCGDQFLIPFVCSFFLIIPPFFPRGCPHLPAYKLWPPQFLCLWHLPHVTPLWSACLPLLRPLPSILFFKDAGRSPSFPDTLPRGPLHVRACSLRLLPVHASIRTFSPTLCGALLCGASSG